MSGKRLSTKRLPALVVLVASLLGAVLALAEERTPSVPAPSGSASSVESSTPPASASASADLPPAAPSVAPSTSGVSIYVAPTYTSGVAPMPSGSAVPLAWLPPGAEAPDPGPSRAIFPQQSLTLRFNHKKHVQDQHLACTMCHAAALASTLSSDFLIPKNHEICGDCHAIDDADPLKDDSPPARCDTCHLGGSMVGGKFVPQALVVPTPNLKMNHKAHLAKGVACQTCHGEVQNLEQATRDQMPRMKGCFSCHQSSDAGGVGKMGGAKSACTTCHVAELGLVKTSWPSGMMLPPRWLKNASHGSDWLERHKRVAGADSAFCANCHTERQCTDCHDGKTRPRDVHPNDWISMHPVAARFDQPKCTNCHSTSNFCTPCHVRAGIAASSPGSVLTAARFHPPAAIWSSSKRGLGHHSFEAQKNMNACVSCHVERDCVVCHGTQGVGGSGASPHGAKFRDKCSVMFSKNPRPCFVCHAPGDQALVQCR